MSDQTHYSVSKAAQQLDIDGRIIKSTQTGEIDCDDLARVLDEIAVSEPLRPILMNVNFGTTQTGALDYIPTIYKLLKEKVETRGILFSIHIDAALMGAVIPIINPFGMVNYFEDFEVKTIAISGHKFFGSVVICGICLTTDSFLKRCLERRNESVNYLTGIHDITLTGSRSGFNVLSFHNTLCGLYMHTNAHGLRQIVLQCYRNVNYFIKRLSKLIPPDQIIHPRHSLSVCFTPRPSASTMDRYSIMPVLLPQKADMPYAGVCILINVGPAMIDQFLTEYNHDLVRGAEKRTKNEEINTVFVPSKDDDSSSTSDMTSNPEPGVVISSDSSDEDSLETTSS
jgi:histidine decarboxylase